MHADILETDRKIYSAANLAGEIGGFASAVIIFIFMLLPFVTSAELEAFLISNLYR